MKNIKLLKIKKIIDKELNNNMDPNFEVLLGDIYDYIKEQLGDNK